MEALIEIAKRFQTDYEAYYEFKDHPGLKNLTEEEKDLLVKTEPLLLSFFHGRSYEVEREALAKNGNCIQYVTRPTREEIIWSFDVPGISYSELIERSDDLGFIDEGLVWGDDGAYKMCYSFYDLEDIVHPDDCSKTCLDDRDIVRIAERKKKEVHGY